MQEIQADTAAINQSRKDGNKEAFIELVAERDSDQAEYEAYEKELADAEAARDRLEGTVDAAGAEARQTARDRRAMAVAETVADIETTVFETEADLSNRDTGKADREAARMMLEAKQAKASAAAGAANGLTQAEKSAKAAEKYLASAGTSKTDADALWDQMGEPSAEPTAK